MPHFQSNMEEAVPWTLKGDYEFIPNRYLRPLRVGIVNNCLGPGLWELIATDRSGEIHHSWFALPQERYFRLTAASNNLDLDFVREALAWKTTGARLSLDRLRREGALLGEGRVTLVDAPVGFSSQGSRLKLNAAFVKVSKDGRLMPPKRLADLHTSKVSMPAFVEPGRYSLTNSRQFDFAFLTDVSTAEVRAVVPLTHYRWNDERREPAREAGEDHLELKIHVGSRYILLGNMPMSRMVKQEDFVIHSFGVGVLGPDTPAERSLMLTQHGPHPPYAYVAEERDGELYAVNSHELGLEEIFIRTYPSAPDPHWVIVLTSFERIVDVIRYRVEIPESLRARLAQRTAEYVSPPYLTYKDDNVR